MGAVGLQVGGVLGRVDPRYVSISYDASFMRRRVDGHPLFNISDPRLHALLRELAPSILRIGGTAGDHWQFGGAPIVPNPAPAQFTVPPDIWDEVVTAFARRSNMQIVVGLSSFTRDKSNRWNSTNAQGLAEYNLRRFGGRVVGYELGNEPGLHLHPPYGKNGVNASDRAQALPLLLLTAAAHPVHHA